MTTHAYRTRSLIALVAGFFLLLLSAGASVVISFEQQNAARDVSHTLEILNQLNRVGTLATDAETGQRGYLLTGRLDYLEPYDIARRDLRPALDHLSDALGMDRSQSIRLAKLNELVSRKLNELKTTIEFRASGRSADALAVVNSDAGKNVMTELRLVIEEMRSSQSERVDVRSHRAAALTVMARTALVGSVVLVLLLAALVLVDVRARVQALGEANDRLNDEARSRAEAETQLRQLQKMEAVGQLTGGIAHDFNNMLAIVIGSLEMARRRLNGQEDPRIKSCLENATEGASRAASLTARLLAFSRQLPLEPVVLDVNKLVANTSELLRRTLGETIQIETVLAGGLWCTLADAAQLESAVVNLAVNARDAMPLGGKLTIETGNGDLDERYAAAHAEVTPGQYVLISVSDTGEGMPPDVAARAFDPFFSTKGVGKGTGLGLSQVFGFVKQSGGHVKIYSELRRGTTVKIYMPRHRSGGVPQPSTALPVKETPRGRSSEIIMVVEDEEAVRMMSVDVLRELGYTVVHFGSAQEALAALDAQPTVSLLFTDVVMPGMDGHELFEAARARRPSLKVLYTTGYTRNAIVHNGVVDSGTALITKPFSLDLLASKVRKILDDA